MTASKKQQDVERRLEDLEGGSDEDGDDRRGPYPEADIATMLGAMNTDEYDPMDGEPGLIRCLGEVYRVPDFPSDALEAFGRDDSGDGESEDKNAGEDNNENGDRGQP